MTLKVLTLNLWNRSGPYAERRPLIRSWIEQLQPDLIGFQEALRSDGDDQVAELLAGLEYQIDFVKAVDFWDDARMAFGNAVASRWPIRERETLRLPDAGDAEQRAAITVTVDAPFGPIGFTCTHLNWKLHHGWVRERQVVAVTEFARARRPRGGFPPILVGDFNAQPESTEIRYVKGLHALDGGSVHFRDAYAIAGDGDGTTWSNRNDYARPSLEPDRRIDYIFVGPPQRDGVGNIEHCRVVCNTSDHRVWPTDHFGVYAELRTEPLK
ncbi:MAG: endonuclease/exonuclease/phosphatase family protein [Dehalococcoidia bacterium]